ncbi:MAG TPA: hypothetical protein PKX48_13640 [Planctomycetota bacterium]|jgi:hypothetical protein|nr:hypothetical protein [Planctomycetota bacterium]OQC21753.1 MAG: hypothetical protein BWX69_00683 [Planctomycetes bacterium ADurb.Bin069]HNS00096.1 hypothetical protein [Planctomycetota bacterium]HNU26388.1 hypothetical protein [Planctomycetota bacterium]HOE29723.1 hypothetical protein [Planctomycetota bacterium]
MRRAAGYVFLCAVAAAGVFALAGRFHGAGAVEPPGAKTPDWLGVALIAAALAAGAGVMLSRDKKGSDDGGKAHR